MRYYIAAFFCRIIYFLIRVAFLFYYSIRIEGKENVPKNTAAIFASNHRSYLDPVLVAMSARNPFCFIAKEPLFKNPFFGTFIRLLGAFPTTDSKNPEYDMLGEAIQRMEDRRNLTIFPEGTRHTDGKVGRCKSGVCVLAARSGKPVVPVGLIFNSNNLHFRSKICVRIGTPILASDYGLTAESAPNEMHQMRQDIQSTLQTLVEENPPFPIKHDAPKKRTKRELAREQRKMELKQKSTMQTTADNTSKTEE